MREALSPRSGRSRLVVAVALQPLLEHALSCGATIGLLAGVKDRANLAAARSRAAVLLALLERDPPQLPGPAGGRQEAAMGMARDLACAAEGRARRRRE
jgi:hypothetical protein